MDAFSYLSVLLSIILGLAIAQVLQGYRALLLSRTRVTIYLPSIIWSALLLIFSAQFWWASYGLASHAEWTFSAFGTVLLQTILLYMMSALVLPDLPHSGELDLKEHYYREVGPFFGISLMMLAVSVVKDWTLNGRLPDPVNLAFHGTFAAISITALASRRPRVHELVSAAMVVFVLAYIGLLFARLGH